MRLCERGLPEQAARSQTGAVDDVRLAQHEADVHIGVLLQRQPHPGLPYRLASLLRLSTERSTFRARLAMNNSASHNPLSTGPLTSLA